MIARWDALGVRAQLLLLFGAVLLFMLAALASAILALQGARSAMEAARAAIPNAVAARAAELDMISVDDDVANYVLTARPKKNDINLGYYFSDLKALTDTTKQLDADEHSSEQRRALTAFERAAFGAGGYLSQIKAAADAKLAGHTARAGALVVASNTDTAQNAIHAYGDAVSKQANATIDAATSQTNSAMIAAISVGIFALALGIALAILCAQRISKAFGLTTRALSNVVDRDFAALSTALSHLAEGDLRGGFVSARDMLQIGGSAEIAHLTASYNSLASGLTSIADGFERTVAHLREILVKVGSSAERVGGMSHGLFGSARQSSDAVEHISRAVAEVTTGARFQADQLRLAASSLEEMTHNAQAIAEGAGEQAAAIDASRQAIRDLRDHVQSTAEVAGELARAATESTDQVRAGTSAVSQTREAIEQIGRESERAVASITELASRSNAVGEIIGAIEEIADQTNLLALNAAIEAARAGEQGRGFAVVADEVRKLAERAASSVREIGGILSNVRIETVTAEEAIVKSAQSTQSCLSLANRAYEALESLQAAIARNDTGAHAVAASASAIQTASEQLERLATGVGTIAAQAVERTEAMREAVLRSEDTMAEVAASAQEQANAAEQVLLSVRELASDVQMLSHTAQSLGDESTEMEHVVSVFTVTDAALPSGNGVAVAALSSST